ncbi:hypothetical protein GCM10008927_28700 [Amylibacter ulvae]|uniref:PEBP family protein n=1 Tax=Paramylibacter ulvae TaxID=1651968 RepID=A0ABQ3D6J2_9RHOB|nr:PEBP family protein [Amylibacter ulvae]GHA61475.1 hypothetical protein GCM10008927_28700 [Amylibacter ulvae]
MRIILPTLFAATMIPAISIAETYSVDVWADNWFEMRIDGVQVAEDSVPITTERSFNAESFTFVAAAPFVIGVVAKDFKENDTGLEYIGSRRQQMGDGGLIVQVKNSAGETVVVSDESWQCAVTHTAPLEKSCEKSENPVAGEGVCLFEAADEPQGWDHADFDASDWPAASVYSAAAVDPKMGYNDINWDDHAAFIWGPDLEQSNTVLCRVSVE